MDALMEKYNLKAATSKKATGKHRYQSMSHSHLKVVENGQGEIFHLELTPDQYGAYFMACLDLIESAPESERNCLSLPYARGFINISPSDAELHAEIAEGMEMELLHEYTSKDIQGGVAVTDFGKKVVSGIDAARASAVAGGAVAAYFIYKPYVYGDFLVKNEGKRPRVMRADECVPAAMCALQQLRNLGFTLFTSPQRPYGDEVMCMRDGKVALVVTYLEYMRCDQNNTFRNFFAQFLHSWDWSQHVFDTVKAASVLPHEDFDKLLFATYRPMLV